jgi:hypothetical protein
VTFPYRRRDLGEMGVLNNLGDCLILFSKCLYYTSLNGEFVGRQCSLFTFCDDCQSTVTVNFSRVTRDGVIDSDQDRHPGNYTKR